MNIIINANDWIEVNILNGELLITTQDENGDGVSIKTNNRRFIRHFIEDSKKVKL